jgi:hypothetical protein
MSASDSTDSKLAQALSECERLRLENRQLRERLGIPLVDTAVRIVSGSSTQVTVTAKSSVSDRRIHASGRADFLISKVRRACPATWPKLAV